MTLLRSRVLVHDANTSGAKVIVCGYELLEEIEAGRRLVELDDRLAFFPVRAERGEINRTGGQAARAEFDGVLNAMAAAEGLPDYAFTTLPHPTAELRSAAVRAASVPASATTSQRGSARNAGSSTARP